MLFLGYNFCSGANSLSPTPSMNGIITAIQIFDGKYNSLFISSNTDLTLDDLTAEWDYDTKLMTDFTQGLNAGNSGFSLKNTDHLLIKRRESGELKWTVLYVKEVNTTDDFKILFTDKYARSGVEYEYAISSTINGVENSYVVQNVYSDFDGMYITDKDCLYGTIFDVDCSSQSMNLANQTLALFNSEYMTVVSNSKVRGESGSVSGTYIKFDDNDINKFNRNASIKYRQEIKNRLANKKPLILKICDGRIWMVKVTGQPTESHDSHFDVRQISFEWMEVGDINDMETLYINGFSDVGEEWW